MLHLTLKEKELLKIEALAKRFGMTTDPSKSHPIVKDPEGRARRFLQTTIEFGQVVSTKEEAKELAELSKKHAIPVIMLR